MTRHDPALAAKLYARAPSRLEETLFLHLRAAKLPEPEREYRFHPVRRWRFDFAWPDLMLAVECEGLTAPGTKSRHTTNQGFTKDCGKYNAAAMAGWKVLRFTSQMIKSGEALQQIEEALNDNS